MAVKWVKLCWWEVWVGGKSVWGVGVGGESVLGEVCESLRVWVGSLCRVCAHTQTERETERERERERETEREAECMSIDQHDQEP